MTSIAPADRRRFCAPEGSIRPLPDPLVFPPNELALIDPDTLIRRDGRYPEQVRPLVMNLGLVSQAPGSVFVECGLTKLVCCVYGPRSGSSSGSSTFTTSTTTMASRTFHTLGGITCEINYAPFSKTGVRGPHYPDTEEEDLARRLVQALAPALRRELFPNTTVDIYITVLERDGNILGVAMTAASIALAQAKVDLFDLVIGMTAVWHPRHKIFIMDPTQIEEEQGDQEEQKEPEQSTNSSIRPSRKRLPRLTMAMMPNLGLISEFNLVGEIEEANLMEAMAICSDAINTINEAVVRPALARISIPELPTFSSL